VQEAGGAGGEAGDHEREVSASFFEKKAAKKRLLLGDLATPLPNPPGAKVFWFFFSKKNVLLAFLHDLFLTSDACPPTPALRRRAGFVINRV
jgi:hypothetical protein